MYQTIGEKISVIGIYKQGKFIPKKFQWNGNILNIDEITLTADIKDGTIRKRMYSVVCKGNVYRLMFDRQQEIWEVAEVWYV